VPLGSLWDRFVTGLQRYFFGPLEVTPGEISWFVDRFPRFVAVLVLFYLLSRGIVGILDRTLLTEERVRPMVASIADRLIFGLTMFVGIGLSLTYFGINILDLAVTLGLVGAGLALGLRESVANIMGGIALATDRPFEVGDRIQIGDYWGDVEEIGLRSTRILTARREYVIVPNRLMDEREIWNFTKGYPELRIEVAVEISYESNVDLAERLMLQAAREHGHVLEFPEPRVLVQQAGDSGVELELWCHTSETRNRYQIASDLRKATLQAFEEHGVAVPYPHRTLVDKADQDEPAAEIPDDLGQSPLGPRRLLVATSGPSPARRKADAIIDLAEQLDANIVLAHIPTRPSLHDRRAGERAAEVFQATAAGRDVGIDLVMESGNFVERIPELVDRYACGAVALGPPRQSKLMAWRERDTVDRLRSRLDVPLVIVDPEASIEDIDLEEVGLALAEREAELAETT
jgi:small-conductance mechanosensitive channel